MFALYQIFYERKIMDVIKTVDGREFPVLVHMHSTIKALNLVGITSFDFSNTILDESLTNIDLSGSLFLNTHILSCDLDGSNISNCNFTGAEISYLSISCANASGVIGFPDAPKVDFIDSRILQAIEKNKDLFCMDSWHDEGHCGTTHCRAGWAVHLAGLAGYELELKYDTSLAGALIYLVSSNNKIVPDFFTENHVAIEDIKARAAEEEKKMVGI